MLMHEWIRYRNQQVKPGSTDGQDTRPQDDARPEEPASAGLTLAGDERDATVAEAEPLDALAAEAEASAAPAAEETVAAGQVVATEIPERPAQAARPRTERTDRDREEVLASLEQEVGRAGESIRERFRQLQARQRQLPIEVEESEDEPDEGRPRRVSETRQELVQRLLDPTLTLRESALLLDVCPTTVRRYTNRGLLKCYRTPGNQRRFRLADLLDFMERREQGEI